MCYITSFFVIDKHGVLTMHCAPHGRVCAMRRTPKCAPHFNVGFRRPIVMGFSNYYLLCYGELKARQETSKQP